MFFHFLPIILKLIHFISDFGSEYEKTKGFYETSIFKENANNETRKKIVSIIELILVGKYKNEKKQDWIENKQQKISLSNASSGQQEALPMLLVMYIWSLLSFGDRKPTIFIEEPEAHLFPVSQKHIVSLLGLIYNSTKHNFVITTHSPYILTAINNMILARDVANEKGKEALKDIVDYDLTIDYEDVKAYTIQNGVLVSILDDETRLIGENIIDSVSDEFSETFDSLINLQAGI